MILIFYSLPAQILFNEFMIDPENDNTGEFIEIYNAGDTLIDLRNCYLCDAQDTDAVIVFPDSLLKPGEYGLILDPDYAGEYDDLIPDNIPRFSISDSRLGMYGISNSTSKLFALLNYQLSTLDTYLTGTPVWPHSGFTIERNSIFNDIWTTSLSEKGTPGYKNSTAIKDHDLFLSDLVCTSKDSLIAIEFFVNNSGSMDLSDFHYGYIVDIPFIDNSYNDTLLYSNPGIFDSGDSVHFSFEYIPPILGGIRIIAFARLNTTVSDTLIADMFIPIPENGIMVTEFVAKTGVEFTSEYVEILNITELPISLLGLEIHDLTGYTVLDSCCVLRPDSMLVLAQSASFRDDFPYTDNYIIPPAWRSLNNSEDVIRLMNPTGSLIFNLQYSADWDIPYDCAMLLVDTALDHQDPNNWDVSRFGSPGQNNVTEKQLHHLSCYFEKGFCTTKDTLQFYIINDGYFPVEEGGCSFITPSSEQIINYPGTQPGDTLCFQIDTAGLFIEGTNRCTLSIAGTHGFRSIPTHIKYYLPYNRSPVFLNEIMFYPIDTYGQVEFIELESNSIPFDLDHWTIKVNNSECELFDSLFSTFTVICDADDPVEGIGSSAVMAFSKFPSLPNSGAEVFLLDPIGRTMDLADLRNHHHITEGKSLEKQFLSLSSLDRDLWFSSVGGTGMTPGKMNSIASLPGYRNDLAIYPQVFAPGHDDMIQFSIDSETGINHCELLCFNLAGQCVYRYEQNVFSNPSFLHYWNGKMGNGMFPARGIYLIIVNITTLEDEQIKLGGTLIIR